MIAALAVATLAVVAVALPHLRIEARRRRSLTVAPARGQLWVQDGQLIYIEYADATGVEVISKIDGGGVVRWKDTREQWALRLRRRALWFTGQVREL
jgi:hypothetical protein